MDVTQAWMTGVVTAMAIFGSFALVGYFIKRTRDQKSNQLEKG